MTEQTELSARARAVEMGLLDRLFRLREAGTDTRTELEAGFTTFLTMAYILVVNPQILSEAGVPIEGALFATAVASALGSILMGVLANYPFALAPGMGLNAYFTYTVVLGMGVPWQTALGAVFLSGVAFILLTIGRIRELVIRGIPMTLKLATGAGIGLFIAFIGLRNAGVVTANPATMVTLGDVTGASVLLAAAGLIVTAALMARGWKTAIILGIIVTAAAAYVVGVGEPPTRIVSIPDPSSTWLAMDVKAAISLGLFQVIFVFLFVDMFDSVGTLVGLGRQAGFLTPSGDLPRAQRALMADAVATTAGAVLGTSTVTAYVESATGVAEGGRTGLAAVTVGGLFLLAVFFSPIAAAVPAVATAPALIIVGSLMLRAAVAIDWNDATEAVPAFLTLIGMPLTFSIANGLAIGFVSYPVIKILAGRGREVGVLTYSLAVLFLLRFAFLGGG
ncbi:MAG TPA: NCS2 family permease [Longimicrobiaceae bacterium]